MGPGTLTLRRGAVVASILVVSTWMGTASVLAQGKDVCAVLSPEQISAVAPGTYDQPFPFPDGCQWHGTTADGAAVDLMLVSTTGTADDYRMDGSQASTVAGYPAASMVDPTSDPPGAGVVVDLGGQVVLLTLSSDDATIDLAGAASGLAELAVPELAQSSGSTGGGDTGTAADSTAGDPCALFTGQELAPLLGADVAPFPDGGSCRWESADASTSVSAGLDAAGLTEIKSLFPGGEDITLGGQPAYQTDQSLPGLGVSQVATGLGPDTLTLLVSSTDETLDVTAIARQLTELAVDRGIQAAIEGQPEPVETQPEPAPVASPCQLVTPEEIAAAAGLEVKLKARDLEVACDYEGGKGQKHILIYVSTQDPTTFDGMIASVGATEIEGPGDISWWWKDYSSLFSRQGDLILQVAVNPDRKTPDARLQEMAVAIMETLLAP